MTIKISAHGGNCCGIKHIWGFGQHATENTSLPSYKKEVHSGDHGGREDNCFPIDRPAETMKQRFHGLLHNLCKYRSNGLVEIVLVEGGYTGDIDEEAERYCSCSYPCDGDEPCEIFNQVQFFPMVEEVGFKAVSRFHNENSGHVVRVYHLAMTDDWCEEFQKKFPDHVAPKKKAPAKKAAFL